MVALDGWSRSLPTVPSVVASEARDITMAHERAFVGIAGVPMLGKYRGEAFVGPFVKAIERCVEYVEGAV